MTVFSQIKQNNWPSSFNSPSDYLALACPFNTTTGFASFESHVGSRLLRPTRQTFGTSGIANISTEQSKFYGSSLRTSNGGILFFNSIAQSMILSGDFTLEAWVWIESGASDCIIFGYTDASGGGGNQKAGFGVRGTGSGGSNPSRMNAYDEASNGSDGDQSSAVWVYGQWNHFCVVRSSSTITYYFNGTSAGTDTCTGPIGNGNSAASSIRVGYSNPFVANKAMYINDLRVYAGFAKYTGAFTPPGPMYGSP